jgi:hypothetical protein
MVPKLFLASIVRSPSCHGTSITAAEAIETTQKFPWRFVATFAIVLAWAASAAAQTILVGTGDPAIDVPAVQAAVDQGGQIILKGHFSSPATTPEPMRPIPRQATDSCRDTHPTGKVFWASASCRCWGAKSGGV